MEVKWDEKPVADGGEVHITACAPFKCPLNVKTVLKATADNPEVRIEVSPVTDGRATVRCIYQGKVKIYQIN